MDTSFVSSASIRTNPAKISMYATTSKPIREPEEIEELFSKSTIQLSPTKSVTSVSFQGFSTYGQHDINMTLKSTVLDSEDTLEVTQEGQVSRCIAMRQNLKVGNGKRSDALHSFDNGFIWCKPSGYNVLNLMKELSLEVDLDNIANVKEYQIADIMVLSQHLQSLLHEPLNKDDLERVEKDMKSIIHHLSLGRVNCVPTLFKLREFLFSDVLEYVLRKMQEKDEPMNLLYEEIDRCNTEKDFALEQFDVTLLFDKFSELLNLHVMLIECINERVHEVMMGTNDPEKFRQNFNQFQSKVMGSLDTFNHDRKGFKGKILADIRKMKDDAERRTRIHEISIQKAKAWQIESHQRLEANSQKQDEVWSTVIKTIECLSDFARERREEVLEHILRHEKEEERRYQFEEYIVAVKSHTQELEECLAHTEEALKMITVINDYFDTGIQLITKKTFDHILEEMKVTEQKRYYEVVYQYCIIAGDVMEKRGRRIHQLNKQAKDINFEKNFIQETLDPDSDLYRANLIEASEKKDIVNREIQKLQINMAKVLSDFKETGEVLSAQGFPIILPDGEIEYNTAVRKGTFIEKRRQLMERELDAIQEEHRLALQNTSEAEVEVEYYKAKTLNRIKARPAAPDGHPALPAPPPAAIAIVPPALPPTREPALQHEPEPHIALPRVDVSQRERKGDDADDDISNPSPVELGSQKLLERRGD